MADWSHGWQPASALSCDRLAKRTPKPASFQSTAGIAGTRPTLIVTCTPGNHQDQFIAEPVLVVEVLSPTTSATDFSRKLPDYQQIPSMRDILLVSSMERLVRHWRRAPDGWIEQASRGSAAVRLSGLTVSITMHDLYDRILPG
jgi:Uma2 family endonuclease